LCERRGGLSPYVEDEMRLGKRESATAMAVRPAEGATALSILYLEGDLRAPVTLELRRGVEALLRRGRRCILLDVANVTDLDAAGLGELVRVYTLAAAARSELWVRNTTPRARKLLDLAGLFEVLSVPSPLAYERCS
jgi:anti-anti-sigma factor